MAKDIPIIYENRASNNCTIKTEYSVIIFSEKVQIVKEEEGLEEGEGETEGERVHTTYTPWMVIRAPTSASFYYPSKSAVGASWSSKTTTNYCGPFSAFPGTTWNLKQPLETDCPMLTKDPDISPTSDPSIVVNNVAPTEWEGQPFNVALYKLNRVIYVEENLLPGQQIVLKPPTILWFAVVEDNRLNELKKPCSHLEVFCTKLRIDLEECNKGVRLVLHYNKEDDELILASQIL